MSHATDSFELVRFSSGFGKPKKWNPFESLILDCRAQGLKRNSNSQCSSQMNSKLNEESKLIQITRAWFIAVNLSLYT